MVTDIKKQLGNRIQKMRKAKGLSQEKFAEMIGIAVSSLSAVETGKSFMSFPNLEKVMDVLDIEPYELFVFGKEKSSDIMYDDILKKIAAIKDNKKKLHLIAEILDHLE
jgi:transcriptional regulator with XRE-family HTH domain